MWSGSGRQSRAGPEAISRRLQWSVATSRFCRRRFRRATSFAPLRKRLAPSPDGGDHPRQVLEELASLLVQPGQAARAPPSQYRNAADKLYRRMPVQTALRDLAQEAAAVGMSKHHLGRIYTEKRLQLRSFI